MTEKQMRKFLKKIRRKPMTRAQIEHFCARLKLQEPTKEINSLYRDKMIRMVSRPHYDMTKGGQFISSKDDLFAITDVGKDYLADNAKDKFRFTFQQIPVIISTLIALISLIVSIIALSNSNDQTKCICPQSEPPMIQQVKTE